MSHHVRRLLQYVLFSLAIAAFANACGGNAAGPGSCGNLTPANGTSSMKIDGDDWSATTTLAIFNGGLLGFSGSDGCNPLRTFAWALLPNGTGTYTINLNDFAGLNARLIVGNTATWQSAPLTGTGTLTITALSATAAKGKFEFTLIAASGGATGQKVVTSGTFDLKY